jgi:hypothetical protein
MNQTCNIRQSNSEAMHSQLLFVGSLGSPEVIVHFDQKHCAEKGTGFTGLHNNSSKNAFMVGQAQRAVKVPVLTIVSKSILPGKANDVQSASSDIVTVLNVKYGNKKDKRFLEESVTFENKRRLIITEAVTANIERPYKIFS